MKRPPQSALPPPPSWTVSDATIAEMRQLARADREQEFLDSLPATIEVSASAVWCVVQNGNAPYSFIQALDLHVPGWRDAKRYIEDA